MRRTFIKKEGVVITTLARYLLGEKCGNRLKTIDELATECRSSVGLTQAALKTLESSGAIRIERRGRNGSYLVEMDNKALLSHVDINNVVCAMPLPYTRLYEGLASGLKAQFDGIAYSALFDHGLASKSDQRFASIRSTGNLTFSTAF